jgi:hypothetical protein
MERQGYSAGQRRRPSIPTREAGPRQGPGHGHRAGRVSAILLLAAFLLAVVGGGHAARAQATTPLRTLDLVSLYQTDLRALAVGNAFGPVARGETALLYNPAGLAQEKFEFKIDAGLAVEGEKGDFVTDTYNQLQTTQTSTSTLGYLDKYIGKTHYFRTQTFANAVLDAGGIGIGVGIGVMSQQRYAFQFDDSTGATPNAADLGDTLRVGKRTLDINFAAFAFGVAQGQILFGLNYKNFTYKEETASASFSTIITTSDIDLTTTGPTYEGKGYDLGMLYRVEAFSTLRAQWSITAFNVGGVELADPTPADPATEALEIPATYNVGIAIDPRLPWSPIHLLFTAEFEDVSGAIKVRDPADGMDHDRSTVQRGHYGVELGIWETSTRNHVINLRAGAHRGLFSSGVEINLFSGLRLIYTQYQDNYGHETSKDLHPFQAFQLSIGFAI